ncbi:MAG: flagellar basal-body rod protein FlgG [Nitrospinae bacterium]|nr:flagellar basal-body rod protein FlgG [Nitrospinota bacterium]
MIRALFSAANGMQAQQTNMNVISNNLANVNTSGFKRSRADFQDLFYQTHRAPGTINQAGNEVPTGVQIGLGSKTAATQRIHTEGDLINTKADLDLAITGKGYFQITLPDGSTGYTRNGSFKLNSNGEMVNSDGLLLADGITIPNTATSVSIAQDGTVAYTLSTSTTPVTAGNIQLASFTNDAGLDSLGGSIYKETQTSGTVTLGTPGTNQFGVVQQGFLEQSNVNIVDELVNMIVAQRAYEVNSKAVKSTDEMIQTATNLKR